MLNSDSDADIQTKYGSSRNRLLHMVVISYIHSLPDTVNMANETSESPPRRSDHPIFALASSQFTFSAAGPSDGSTPSFHPPSIKTPHRRKEAERNRTAGGSPYR